MAPPKPAKLDHAGRNVTAGGNVWNISFCPAGCQQGFHSQIRGQQIVLKPKTALRCFNTNVILGRRIKDFLPQKVESDQQNLYRAERKRVRFILTLFSVYREKILNICKLAVI
jgi:hypothetical protein